MEPSGQKRSNVVAYVILFIAAVLVVVGVLLTSPQPAVVSASSIVVGIGTHGNLSSELRSLQSGVKYYRTDITLDPGQISQLNNESQNYGARYLGILDYETLPGGSSNKNWSLDSWNASVANALASYPQISTWEMWNEPWVQIFQTGYMNGSAYNYYIVIKSAYLIIKSKQPNSTVVCFGGAPISDYYMFQWYSQVWSYGAANYCDAISIHAYPNGAALLNQAGTAQSWSAGLSAYENLTHKPIWITEVGIPAYSQALLSPYSQSTQELFLEQSFSFFSNFSYARRVYWYDLWGLSDAATNDFGLLNLSNPYSGTPKPAWSAFLSIYNSSASK